MFSALDFYTENTNKPTEDQKIHVYGNINVKNRIRYILHIHHPSLQIVKPNFQLAYNGLAFPCQKAQGSIILIRFEKEHTQLPSFKNVYFILAGI